MSISPLAANWFVTLFILHVVSLLLHDIYNNTHTHQQSQRGIAHESDQRRGIMSVPFQLLKLCEPQTLPYFHSCHINQPTKNNKQKVIPLKIVPFSKAPYCYTLRFRQRQKTWIKQIVQSSQEEEVCSRSATSTIFDCIRIDMKIENWQHQSCKHVKQTCKNISLGIGLSLPRLVKKVEKFDFKQRRFLLFNFDIFTQEIPS